MCSSFYYCVDFAVYIFILLLAIFFIAFVTADPSFCCPLAALLMQIRHDRTNKGLTYLFNYVGAVFFQQML